MNNSKLPYLTGIAIKGYEPYHWRAVNFLRVANRIPFSVPGSCASHLWFRQTACYQLLSLITWSKGLLYRYLMFHSFSRSAPRCCFFPSVCLLICSICLVGFSAFVSKDASSHFTFTSVLTFLFSLSLCPCLAALSCLPL